MMALAQSSNEEKPPPTPTEENPPKPAASKNEQSKPKVYGEQPYTEAANAYPLGTCPKSGKWEGHFENVGPVSRSRPGRKRKKDKKRGDDNRVREMFYLFFNATPAFDARTAFDDGDSTVVANKLLDDSVDDEKEEKKKGEDGDGGDGGGEGGSAAGGNLPEEAKKTDQNLVPKDHIHVRGYGTNRFGTFEITGGLDPKTGTLQIQRMYVPVPTASEMGKTRTSSGRFLSGLDLTVPGEEEDHEDKEKRGSGGGRSGRKRKSTWKKRDSKEMDSKEKGVDIVGIVKKRSRLSNEDGMGSGKGGGSGLKPPPQSRLDASAYNFQFPSSSGKKPHAPPNRADSTGSGKKGSKKRKGKGGATPVPPPRQPVMQQPAAVIPRPPLMPPPTLPPAGDPFLARWRAAHYLYYQRVEQEPDGEGATWGDGLKSTGSSAAAADGSTPGAGDDKTLVKINSVVYEGEMLNGEREGKGICLYNNNTLYEGQWKRNKEHGFGTLMSVDRSRII
jgi:hypothetical protein